MDLNQIASEPFNRDFEIEYAKQHNFMWYINVQEQGYGSYVIESNKEFNIFERVQLYHWMEYVVGNYCALIFFNQTITIPLITPWWQ